MTTSNERRSGSLLSSKRPGHRGTTHRWRIRDRSQDRRPARTGRLQVHAGHPRRQTRARDQLVLQPARRGPRGFHPAARRDRAEEQAALDRARGDRRRRHLRGAPGGIRRQVGRLPEEGGRGGSGASVVRTPREKMDTVEPSGRSVLKSRRLLLGVTGGIAAYKACVLTRLLRLRGASVRVVMTRTAERFVGPATFAALTDHRVYTDLFDDDPGHVLHVRLAHEADIVVVAPATANVIAKLAFGIADDLLTSTLLEARCPFVVAPAMHAGMWEHEATQANVAALVERGIRIIGPARGSLAAGDEGVGRMSEPDEILAVIEDALSRGKDLAGRRVVVSAGPTWEPIDPVRFVGNRSTGRMGFAVAAEAPGRGADVTLVVGPGTIEPPEGPRVVRVTTADEMRHAVFEEAEGADAVVMAAAVADFRPERTAGSKIKKEDGTPDLRLVPTPDILSDLSREAGERVLVGFAAETDDVEAGGRDKLARKGVDLLVANQVGREGTGFGSETNRAAIFSRIGEDEPLREWSKRELAAAICDRLVKLLAR